MRRVKKLCSLIISAIFLLTSVPYPAYGMRRLAPASRYDGTGSEDEEHRKQVAEVQWFINLEASKIMRDSFNEGQIRHLAKGLASLFVTGKFTLESVEELLAEKTLAMPGAKKRRELAKLIHSMPGFRSVEMAKGKETAPLALSNIPSSILENKTAFVRADVNIKYKNGKAREDDEKIIKLFRIVRTIMAEGMSGIIATHKGRPEGYEAKESVRPIYEILAEKYGRDKIGFLDYKELGKEALSTQKAIELMKEKGYQIVLLDNLRFIPEETEGDEDFARSLVNGVDMYIFDGPAVAHRPKHASVSAAQFAPLSVLGAVAQEERDIMEQYLDADLTFYGGAKNVDKLKRNKDGSINFAKSEGKMFALYGDLLAAKELDKKIFIGGTMLNSFLAAKGFHLGDSLGCSAEEVEVARAILDKIKELGIEENVTIPQNLTIAKVIRTAEGIQGYEDINPSFDISEQNPVPDSYVAIDRYAVLDIGEEAVKDGLELIKRAKKIDWNGSMGKTDVAEFQKGTDELLRFISGRVEKEEIEFLIAGGDSAVDAKRVGMSDKADLITGGGAYLVFKALQGKMKIYEEFLTQCPPDMPSEEIRKFVEAKLSSKPEIEQFAKSFSEIDLQKETARSSFLHTAQTIARQAAKEAANIMHDYKKFIQPEKGLRKEVDYSIVTKADKKIQERVIELIRKEFPEHGIVAEEKLENVEQKIEAEYIWVIDPIDGTKSFIEGNNEYGFMIALLHKGMPILALLYAPEWNVDNKNQGALFEAIEGIEGAYLNGRKIEISKALDFKNQEILISREKTVTDIEKKVATLFGKVTRTTKSQGFDMVKILRNEEFAGPIAYTHKTPKIWDAIASMFIIIKAGGVVTDFDGNPILPVSHELLQHTSPKFPTLIASSEEANRALLEEKEAIDLQEISGLPIKLGADNKLIFGEGMPQIVPAVRMFKADGVKDKEGLEKVIKDPNIITEENKDTILYDMYRAIYEDEDLRYDITVIPPAMLGTEYVKTTGHFHPGLYPEVYEVLNGEAYYLLQKKDGSDFIVVHAEKGDKVAIPPNYGHITVNAGKETLVMANWVSNRFSSEYGDIKKNRGGMYYLEKDEGGELKITRNPNYKDVPKIRVMKPAELVAEFGLEKDKPMYGLIDKAPEKLDYLNNPQKYEDVFAKALVELKAADVEPFAGISPEDLKYWIRAEDVIKRGGQLYVHLRVFANLLDEEGNFKVPAVNKVFENLDALFSPFGSEKKPFVIVFPNKVSNASGKAYQRIAKFIDRKKGHNCFEFIAEADAKERFEKWGTKNIAGIDVADDKTLYPWHRKIPPSQKTLLAEPKQGEVITPFVPIVFWLRKLSGAEISKEWFREFEEWLVEKYRGKVAVQGIGEMIDALEEGGKFPAAEATTEFIKKRLDVLDAEELLRQAG